MRRQEAQEKSKKDEEKKKREIRKAKRAKTRQRKKGATKAKCLESMDDEAKSGISEIQQIFLSFAEKGKDTVAASMLRPILQKVMGTPMDSTEVEELLANADLNPNSNICFEQFAQMMAVQMKKQAEDVGLDEL